MEVSQLVVTLYVIINIINIILAISIVAFASKSKQNTYFFLWIVSLIFWNISLYLSLPIYPGFTEQGLIHFARVSWGFGLVETYFMILFFYHLGQPLQILKSQISIFKKKIALKKICFLIFTLENIILFYFTVATPYLYAGIEVLEDGSIIDLFGPVYIWWVVQFIGLSFICIPLLLIKIFQNKGIIRLKLIYSLIAFAIFHSMTVYFNVILPTLGDPSYYLLGGVAFGPLGILNLFIILKYRFLGAKLILWKIFRFILECGLTLIGIFLLDYLLIFDPLISLYKPYLLTFAGILLFLLINKVIVPALLKHRDSAFRHAINSLVLRTKGSIPLVELQQYIKNTFKELNITSVEIVIVDNTVSHVNLPKYPKNELTNYLQQHGSELLTDDIQYQERPHTKEELTLLVHLSVLETKACFPLFHQEKLIGMLQLGEKTNGDPYFLEEIEDLKKLADYISAFIITVSLFRQEQETQNELKRTKEISKTNVNVRRMIHDMKNNLHSAHAVIKQLKIQQDFSKLDKVQEKLLDLEDTLTVDDKSVQRSTVETYAFLHSLFKGFEDLFAQKDVIYSYTIDVPKDYLCYIDRKKTKSALENLLFNAFKFTPSGETVSVKVKYFSPTKEGIISIKNTGVSIPESNKELIFTEGYTTDAVKGTGLGLATVKKFLEMVGGEIHEYGTPGKNTIFTIKLPLKEPPIHIFHRN